MKASELMIGDWVIRRGVPEEPMRLYDMKALSGIAYLDQDGRGIAEKFENIKPILLTPEILEKNGFLYRKSSFYYIINDDKDLECTHYIYQTIQEDWVIGVDIGTDDCSVFARIKHVHELQHALKLCKIDKEIVV